MFRVQSFALTWFPCRRAPTTSAGVSDLTRPRIRLAGTISAHHEHHASQSVSRHDTLSRTLPLQCSLG